MNRIAGLDQAFFGQGLGGARTELVQAGAALLWATNITHDLCGWEPSYQD
jgi:hypothetical protein